MKVKCVFMDAVRAQEAFAAEVELDSKGRFDRAALERLATEHGFRLQAVNRLADKSDAHLVATVLPAGLTARAVPRRPARGKPVTRGGQPIDGRVPTSPTVAAKRRARSGP